MAIRVVVAEDAYLIRVTLERLVRQHDDLELAAVCGDLDSLLSAVAAGPPDVVPTDIRMPPDSSDEGVRAAERLRSTHPEVGALVLSQ